MTCRRKFLSVIGLASANAMGVPIVGSDTKSTPPIVIGQSTILSGPLGESRKVANTGAQLVFDAVNRAGGIAGRKLELLSLDDGLQAEKTLANCNALVSRHNAVALFGFLGSSNEVAVEPLLRESGVALIGNYAIGDAAREKMGSTSYFVRANYFHESERLARQMATLGLSRIAIVYYDVPGGQEVRATLVEQLAKFGITPMVVAGVATDGSNIDSAVKAVGPAMPQAVIMYLGGAAPAKFIAGMDAKGFFTSYYGFSSVPGELTAKILGASLRSLVISQVMPYPWSQTDVGILQYRKLAKEANVPVTYSSYECFVTASVLVEALRRAGPNVSRPLVHAAMRSLKGQIAGLPVNFTGGRSTGSQFVELVQITGSGRFSR